MRYNTFLAEYNPVVPFTRMMDRGKLERILRDPSGDFLNQSLYWTGVILAFSRLGVGGLTHEMFNHADSFGWGPESEPLRQAFQSLLWEPKTLEEYL